MRRVTEPRGPAANAAAEHRNEPQSILREASRHWYWMPTAVLALGLVALTMLVGVDRIIERLIVRDIARLRVMGEIQRDVSISHLWLEEYVSGDRLVPKEEIWQRVESSLRLSRELIEQGETAEGLDDVRPLEDPQLLRRARILREQIQSFGAISRDRREGYEAGNEALVAIGSDMDQRYDAIFNDLLTTAQDLESRIRSRLATNRDTSRALFRTVFGAWLAIVALAVTGLWTRERRRHQAEEALRRSEAQLLQSQKMEAVGRLAGGIAHDVNNYLAAITAQCELVKRKASPGSPVITKMDAIINSSFKVSSLIKRLLAFSRQQSVQPEVVNLNGVVEELQKMMERLIGEDIELTSRLDDQLWDVKIDPSQLEQIIVNLLVNARDAMPTGGEVTIETSNLPLEAEDPGMDGLAPGDYVRLTVRDTGVGIDPDIVDKIFEPFFTTKGKSGSSGLGLATVYGIVEQNGGVIQVNTVPGQGTVFEILLPRTRDARPSAVGDDPDASLVGGSERILLVEDNEDLRGSTKGVLQALGYEVTVASDGERGARVFEAMADHFDLVVTDVVMPGMSGREMADRIHRSRPGMKVLFVSGYTDNVILRHGIMEGEVDFLEKPFMAEKLARKVREVLDRKSHSQPLTAAQG